MANVRRKLSPSDEIALTTQVQGTCPLCGKRLFYVKADGKNRKAYEIAHIYPLNPNPEELALLASEPRLSHDPNHVHNLIPLCLLCHGKFDKPRTVAEYNELLEIKKLLIQRERLQELQAIYPIEDDIAKIIEGLYSDNLSALSQSLGYDPKTVDEKLDDTVPHITAQKIKHYVTNYFPYVKERLVEVESTNPTAADLISSQVKTFYLAQKNNGLSQQAIFSNISKWIHDKTNPETSEAAEIVTAFFIQNCEVFE